MRCLGLRTHTTYDACPAVFYGLCDSGLKSYAEYVDVIFGSLSLVLLQVPPVFQWPGLLIFVGLGKLPWLFRSPV